MEKIMEFEFSKEFLERFKLALTDRDDVYIQDSLEGVRSADICEILTEIAIEEGKYVFDMLSSDIAADVLVELEEDFRVEFMEYFSINELANFIEILDSDDGADLLNEMSSQRREEILEQIKNEEKAGHLLDLIRYDEDVAGGLMAKELVKARENWTVKRCIEEIKIQAENVEKIYSVYVVDQQDRLKGRVSLKRILLADDDKKVAEIFEENIISVGIFLEAQEVANIMQKYDLDAVPVVNVRGKLVGRITIDDVVDVITESAEEERQLMSGVTSDIEEDDGVWVISKARLPWLVIGMTGGLIAAQIADYYSGTLNVIARLSLFIPLIMATGGNVGIQSSAIVIQSLAGKNGFNDTLGNRLLKMFYVAMVNGSILSLMVFGAIMLLFKDQLLAITASIALLNVVLLASFMGTITPLLLDRFGINPAIASGPFITTANDLLGLTVYFSIAVFLYNL
ncbi:magnesium transporter [Cyclobacteriaceae bacterium]|jgi:magnesium transporter|nr:magnesium transporter [Cyclobacteriaceae bacterium]MDA9906083.1 magnesium transporter [Cyclobacteriaceae bacterium]MDB4315683.1 magnesium transporter [Cyclobacteriaceae bacterium]MDB4603300.1 magnesium transporter [Cyclobacteriaceae bacterium]|tara:strand:- start:9 stop:1373 length:1365 start_codon:yes stop_codon:yes gene_type:complete